MKNLFLTIVSVLIINTITAQQNDLAYLNPNEFEVYNNKTINSEKNAEPTGAYYKKVVRANSSDIVSKLEKQVLNYNLKNKTVYDNSEAASYRVTFKNKSGKALVDYNNDGIILFSKEVYHNIRIPYQIRVSIAQLFPNWAIKKNTYRVNYSRDEHTKKEYSIIIEKGQSSKQLRYDGVTLKRID